ncbi:MAG TPA: EamA family transporter [Candidatus Deferrimicrobium sp.]|nr:EamA family transporter [Candidatus Deferrimicrobium sp.]
MLIATNVKAQTSVISALFAVYVFWGGTYLAMKIAIETIPPFIMGGTRFLTAGLLVYMWEIYRGQKHPEKAHWLYASLLGILMLFFGQGGIIWAQQYVPSGVAAIIFATVPLWMTLISWVSKGTQRPNNLVIFGLFLGFFGIVLQVKNSLLGVGVNQAQLVGYIVLILAALSWAWGSVYSRVFRLPASPLMSVALQMLTGGTLYIVVSLLTGEWKQFGVLSVSLGSILSLGYLILFGSIIGFGAYIWLLKVADPTMVSTYAYVNPVVAVLLGCTLAGEPLTLNDALVAALILTSVVIISRNYRRST